MKVIVIVGPTGVGKTETSIKIAKKIGGEIVSADSMQIYRGMNIGTAKPTEEEMQGIKHYMIDICDCNKNYSAALFARQAQKCIDDIKSHGKIPIIVGGTGLYIDSLLGGFEFGSIKSDETIRKKYEKIAQEKGKEYLHSLLFEIDRESYEKIHFNNVKRVIRALEIYDITGKSLTENNKMQSKKGEKYDTVMIGLTRERSVLYERIDERVNKMLNEGLVNEVKMLYNGKNSMSKTALGGIGYKEVIYYLKGLCTYDEMVHILKRESRHYAKRQMTWFKRNESIKWFDMGENTSDDILSYIENLL